MQQGDLQTAKAMYQYSCDHGFGTGFGPNWGKKNFGMVQKHLEPDEQVLCTFVGLHRFRSMSTHQRNFAYAITNRRIIMAQVRIFGLTRFESVPLNWIMNISFDYESTIGVMKIMMPKDAVTIGMTQESAQALCQELTELLPTIQELARQMSPAQPEEDGGEQAGAEELPAGDEGPDEDTKDVSDTDQT